MWVTESDISNLGSGRMGRFSAGEFPQREAKQITEVAVGRLGPHCIHGTQSIALGVAEVDQRRHRVPTEIAMAGCGRDETIFQLEENSLGGLPADARGSLQPSEVRSFNGFGKFGGGQARQHGKCRPRPHARDCDPPGEGVPQDVRS